MKTLTYSSCRQQGGILVAGLVVAFIIGATLAGYMVMTQSQNTSVVRSQVWNSAIALSEAGVEDALAMINKYNGNFDKLQEWTNSSSLSADNWTAIGGNVYYVRRYLGSNYYDVYVTNANNAPTIHSAGMVHWSYSYASAPLGFLATVNGVAPSSGTTIARKLEVRTKIDPLFNVAMAADKTINLNGNNIMTDSFDSADPDYSDNGSYPTGMPNKTKAGGDVVSNDTIVNTLSVGNAKIKGVVKTGPKGTISIGPNGSVGDRAWVEGGSTGIQPGHSSDDMNVLFPIPEAPDISYYTPPSGFVDGVYYSAILGNHNYVLGNMGSGTYRVLVTGNATLKVTGNINLTGNDIIRIKTNATLKLYMAGSSAKFAGNGIVNENGNAASLYYFGLESNKTLDFAGNAAFTGVIYAPATDFALGGGGSDMYDFVGASVTKTVKMNGHFNFHYDENLRRVGMGRGYIPTKWEEVR